MATGYNPRVCKTLRDEGYFVQTVEHWNAVTRRTNDLYGCVDVLGVGPAGTIAVQVTSRANMASRVTKMRETEAFPFMVAAGWTVEVWGYDKPLHHYRLKRVTLAGNLDT